MDIERYLQEALYYDDLEPGGQWLSPRRTVTEADVVNFAGLSGDYNALHTDAVHAAQHPFGQRAAHGLLTLAIASGLTTRMPVYRLMDPSRLALTELSCRWRKPVFIGDTIQVALSVGEKRLSGRRPGTGKVTLERTVLNQHGEVVMESAWITLMKLRESQA
ncbi:MaoC/PaaZ C-terminal domain-containing protein [Pigmentiphaga sp. GD03639]|uniref:MaoC family dehydratase n=1 Tax=unclassified Pigmentiphaga TaxID=2626614 RepID=UPI000B409599|nr:MULTISPECIES: MaoC/PaaZ C-terminal domain-containing protein [unclassified Pigmentiphaga]MDH2239384.1 MaoC/PaaZ C-terminal domain-containing protein [Pigmentiphaga sp. GD03639]OVZ65386.1 acyl dehydratase [Pigmentiphaga sp. NML030171]